MSRLLERLPADRRAQWALLAVATSTGALLAAVPGLPSGLKALLVCGFVAAGPGAAVLTRLRLPRSAALLLVPVIGISSVVLVTGASALLGWWSPTLLLVLMAVATGTAALPAVRKQGAGP